MPERIRRWAMVAWLASSAVTAVGAPASALPDLGPAAPFTLTDQDGARRSLADLRGTVVLVAFIYASCKDVCLTETAKMVTVQQRLGEDFGRRVRFVSITLDPERDNGEALRRHARHFGARLDGWSFLTGTPGAVREVARAYGVAFRKARSGAVEHNTLASVIDPEGHLRVQYMGVAFDPDELLADLRGLVAEGAGN